MRSPPGERSKTLMKEASHSIELAGPSTICHVRIQEEDPHQTRCRHLDLEFCKFLFFANYPA
jgi:hypothetical protein